MSKLAIFAGALIVGLVFGNSHSDDVKLSVVSKTPTISEKGKQYQPDRELFLNFEAFPDGGAMEEGVSLDSCEDCDNNPYYGHSLRLLSPEAFLSASVTLPEHDQAVLELRHLSSYSDSCPNNGWSPVSVSVNGEQVVSGHSPESHNYLVERWDISDFSSTGNNVIVISADEEQCTHYWVNRVSVFY